MGVKDLANLRQSTSEGFHSSVRSALDAMMADESSRPLATHLKQAWDADSVDEQLKHLNMALDALDAGAEPAQSDEAPVEPEQKDEAPMESAPIDGGFAEADEGEEEDDDDEENEEEEEDDEDADAAELAEFFEKLRQEKAAKEAAEMKAAQMKEAEMKKAEMEKVNVKARKVRRHD